MITICGGTGCTAFGSSAVREAFQQELERRNLAGKVAVKLTGCHGFCEKGPVVVILPSQVFYPSVKVEDVPRIVEKTVLADKVIEELLYVDPATGQRVVHDHEIPFYARQKRLVFQPQRDPRPHRSGGLHRPRRLQGRWRRSFAR